MTSRRAFVGYPLQLQARKPKSIDTLKTDMVATGDIGRLQQIARATGASLVHTVELFDCPDGPKPAALGGYA